MKRKIIQLAGKTAVISIPSDWVKKYNLRKGQELDISENGRELIIKTDNFVAEKEIKINICGLNEQSVKWALSALHKKGYDTIALIYENPKIIYTIQEMVKDVMMGFVVMEQTSKRCVLRSISQDLETEFDSTLRRAFLVTRSLAQGIYSNINNYDLLKDYLESEKINNQLTNFCERILNKQGHKEQDKTSFYYIIVWNLEKVCDEYKNLCQNIYENKLKANQETLDLIKSVNNLFEEFYVCFYRFSLDKIENLNKNKEEILSKLNNLIITQGNVSIICSLKVIVLRITDFNTSTIAINSRF